jgi:hypothetical protein
LVVWLALLDEFLHKVGGFYLRCTHELDFLALIDAFEACSVLNTLKRTVLFASELQKSLRGELEGHRFCELRWLTNRVRLVTHLLELRLDIFQVLKVFMDA